MRTGRGFTWRAVGRLGVVALTLGLVGVVAGPGVAAADAPRPPGAETVLGLVVVAHDGSVDTASLTCDPTGGSHPHAAAACRDLAIAEGDFEELPGDPDTTMCPDVYAPVTVVAAGVWRGDPVEHRARYVNACVLRGATGPVFQL